jgi:hypothetical protein
MEYRTLGGTGMKVSHFCLGAMMFGPMGNLDHDECIKITHAALDAGVNFIDTLGATEIKLTPAVLDRIDAIVPPGVRIDPKDSFIPNPWLDEPARRRFRLP